MITYISRMEKYKDIPNYNGIYQISKEGTILSFSKYKDGKVLNPSISNRGYKYINLTKDKVAKLRTVHQLMAETFLNHKPCGLKLVVHHKDNNPLNNVLDNLEIVTNRENCFTHYKSKYKRGVGFRKDIIKKPYYAMIRINGVQTNLGYYKTELEASNIYQSKLKEL